MRHLGIQRKERRPQQRISLKKKRHARTGQDGKCGIEKNGAVPCELNTAPTAYKTISESVANQMLKVPKAPQDAFGWYLETRMDSVRATASTPVRLQNSGLGVSSGQIKTPLET